jgi:hypothetical protein
LFAIFSDPEVGRVTIEELRSEGFAGGDDIWVFNGEEDLRRARSHGLRTRFIRTAQRAMTNDFRYVEVLEEALRAGELVVAFKVPNEPSADRLARYLRDRSAHSFAYGAHWDFVPVAA